MVDGNGQLFGTQTVGENGNVLELLPEPVVEQKVHKVLVGIPLKGHTPPKSYHDRMLMWQHMGCREVEDYYKKTNPRYVFGLGVLGEILVPYARETLAQAAIDEGCDYLFMIDDDMLAPPDLFFKLAANDKDVCAALAFTRNPNHKPVCYETLEGVDQSTHTKFGFTRFIDNYPKDQLFECDAVGFGAVLIKVDCLKKIPKPWFFGMAQTGEDVQFCVKARKHGFQVWMDSRIKLGHLSDPIVVTEEYSQKWNKLSPEEQDKQYGQFTKYSTDQWKLFNHV